MANQQDVDRAATEAREALQRRDLSTARAALDELTELERTFDAMLAQVSAPAQRERLVDLRAGAQSFHEEYRHQLDELELDMLDPKYEERVRRREQERNEREAAERARATEVLQNLGGPFAALAGLAQLGGNPVTTLAKPAVPNAASEVACPSCRTENPLRAKFCLECGATMARRCASCGSQLGNAKFCPDCGRKAM